jgi:glycosyltransferase involved in cell wall biosynthesis
VTAIRQVDLSLPIPPVKGLGSASACMVVLRWRRQVVGRLIAPVRDGAIEPAVLAASIDRHVTGDAVNCWLDETLGYDEREVTAPSMLTASVAICTRERPDDLVTALTAAVALRPAPAEIIVVDNAPATGRTREVVARFPSVRYAVEERRGLDAARNYALRQAHTDVVAFTDDDAVPEEGWLGALLANFQDARVACATGLTLPLELETDAQELFERQGSFERGFRRRVFDGQRDNPLAVGQIGAGTNMAVRRQLVLDAGGFDERLDAGTPTRSGGDHEIFARLLAAGHRIAYDPAAVNWHRHRRTLAEVIETMHGYGVGVYAMWTGLLLERREIGVLPLAWRWFRNTQLPRALGRGEPGAVRLARAELRGCVRGPRAWFASRRLRRRSA